MNAALKLEAVTPEGWRPELIVAMLKIRGWDWERIAEAHGCHPDTPHNVLYRPMYEIEQRIGDILDENPALIWPDRYNENRRVILKDETGIRRRYSLKKNKDGTWRLCP